MPRIAGIEPSSIVDGPGFRYTIFFQGCSHHCDGCHNKATWDFAGGTNKSTDELMEDIARNPYIDGITLSGGEPFDQPEELLSLLCALKEKHYHVIAFSGYTFEQLLAKKDTAACLNHIDVLIDGEYMSSKRTLSLRFRGSSNQRVIDVPPSLKSGKIQFIDWDTQLSL